MQHAARGRRRRELKSSKKPPHFHDVSLDDAGRISALSFLDGADDWAADSPICRLPYYSLPRGKPSCATVHDLAISTLMHAHHHAGHRRHESANDDSRREPPLLRGLTHYFGATAMSQIQGTRRPIFRHCRDGRGTGRHDFRRNGRHSRSRAS